MGDIFSGVSTLFQDSPGSTGTTPARGARGILRGYQSTAPGVLQLNQEQQPQYLNLGESNLNQILFGGQNGGGLLSQLGRLAPALQGLTQSGSTSAIANLGSNIPALRDLYQNANPELMGLLNNLTRTASEGLAAGNTLAPNDVYNITQSVRGDWANRGLAPSGGAQLDEAVRLATAGEGLRQSRQNYATNVAGVVNQATPDYVSTLYRLGNDVLGQGQNLLSSQQGLANQRWYDPYNPSGASLAGVGAQLGFAKDQANSQAWGNIGNGITQIAGAAFGI